MTILPLSSGSRRGRIALIPLTLVLLAAGCRDPNVPDLNNPSLDDLVQNPTRLKVVTAAQGLLVGARANIAEFNGYVSELGVFGRESYIFDPADNRFESELLFGPLDPGGPRFGGNLWTARYANIRAGNNILNALDNPTLTDMTAAEKTVTRGFAGTMQALDFLLVINTRDTLGAPVDVNRELGAPLAPIEPRDVVFDYIASLLDAADAQLGAGGAFPFALGRGFSDFGDLAAPATFRRFNRALAARVDVYRATLGLAACGAGGVECFDSALVALAASFLDPGGDLALGAYHVFGTGSGDLTNGLYDPTPAKLYAHSSIWDGAEMQGGGALDQRVLDKLVMVAPRVYGQHADSFAFRRYESPTAPVPIIRNEELILLRAEAYAGTGDLTAAVEDVDSVRVRAGRLAPRAAALVALGRDSVVAEIVKQRTYSLLFEGGHRWIDHRRYFGASPNMNLPNQMGDQVFQRMPVPLDECLPRPRPSRGCP